MFRMFVNDSLQGTEFVINSIYDILKAYPITCAAVGLVSLVGYIIYDFKKTVDKTMEETENRLRMDCYS